jgi:putative ABC transport system ATP-binding protein
MMLAMNESLAIETRDLTKIYGSGHTEVVAMRDASVGIRRGQVVALLGPSGAGKSTFLTAVGLINPPSSGQILIGGVPVLDGPSSLVNLRSFRREHIGYIFQKSNLIPFLSARENVQIAMELSGVSPRQARRRALELLNELGVLERAENGPAMLSGGEQQRVAIARALANDPSVILADEPTAALDSHRGRQVMELFRGVAHEHGAGVIVVTHDHRTLEVFDTIYEMEDGLIRQGSSNAVASDVRTGT